MKKEVVKKTGGKVVVAITLIVFSLLLTVNTGFAFRCEGAMIEVGDPKFKVLRKCGEPISKEEIGYTITKDKTRELKIEEWVYGPVGGCYIHLIFTGGQVSKIYSVRE